MKKILPVQALGLESWSLIKQKYQCPQASLLITCELIFLSTGNLLEKNRTKSGLSKQKVLEQYGGSYKNQSEKSQQGPERAASPSQEKERTESSGARATVGPRLNHSLLCTNSVPYIHLCSTLTLCISMVFSPNNELVKNRNNVPLIPMCLVSFAHSAWHTGTRNI